MLARLYADALPAKAVEAPKDERVELTALGRSEQLVEGGAFAPSFTLDSWSTYSPETS